MKLTITLLISSICFSGMADDSGSTFLKRRILESITNGVIYSTNPSVFYGSLIVTNYCPLVRIQPKYANGNEVTNIVILESFKGTIQVGTNFYTLEQFKKGWQEMDKFQIGMAEARGELRAYRDVSLNRTIIENHPSVITNYSFKDCADFETGVEYGVIAFFELNRTNSNPTFEQIENRAKQNLVSVKLKLGIK